MRLLDRLAPTTTLTLRHDAFAMTLSMHRATPCDDTTYRCLMHRTTVAGDRPYGATPGNVLGIPAPGGRARG